MSCPKFNHTVWRAVRHHVDTPEHSNGSRAPSAQKTKSADDFAFLDSSPDIPKRRQLRISRAHTSKSDESFKNAERGHTRLRRARDFRPFKMRAGLGLPHGRIDRAPPSLRWNPVILTHLPGKMNVTMQGAPSPILGPPLDLGMPSMTVVVISDSFPSPSVADTVSCAGVRCGCWKGFAA